MALLALVTILTGCAALYRHAVPYAGSLQPGQLVRAIVEDFGVPYLTAAHRVSRDKSEIEQVSFTNAPNFRPAAGGTMVVFSVVSSWSYHTPDDASGMHEWLSVYDSQLVAVEMNEEEAIAAARSCLEANPDRGSYDLDNPFAFGPGASGGWVVRFENPAQGKAAASVDLEIDRKGHCAPAAPR